LRLWNIEDQQSAESSKFQVLSAEDNKVSTTRKHSCSISSSLTPQPFQTKGYAIFLSLRPLPGGRRSAAARTGVSDCAGFAPN